MNKIAVIIDLLESLERQGKFILIGDLVKYEDIRRLIDVIVQLEQL